MYGIFEDRDINLYNGMPKIFKNVEGKTITNYNISTLKEFELYGLLEVVEVKPEYKSEVEFLKIDYKEIKDGKVYVYYEKNDIISEEVFIND
jgi:hypothetical protein